MIDRRTFLFNALIINGFFAMPGCWKKENFSRPIASEGAIDIHAHIFNANDVPIVGFAQQVLIRDPHRPVEDNFLTEAFLRLVAGVARSNTPTAADELKELRERGLRSADASTLLKEDEENMASALANYTDELQSRGAGLTSQDEQELLARLVSETGFEPTPGALLDADEVGSTMAARVFEREAAGRTDSFQRNSDFVQTLRWAALLTRRRGDLLAELVRLYGGEQQIKVFSPSLVDFQYWFRTQETVTPRREQIELMSLLAKQSRDAVVLNVAPFCPLRAALERDADANADTLSVVRDAVQNKGFVGVKLYPPMGFLPWHNANVSLDGAYRRPRRGGQALDDELKLLYEWCVAEGVPIKAHANNSIAADVCTGQYANPANWRPVLDQYPDLRLNLAHFGGFDEEHAGGDHCGDHGDNWEDELADMLDSYPNLYFDVGYWIEATDNDRVINRTRALLERQPLALERMMYGSDWSMIGRVPGHQSYYADVQTALFKIGLEDSEINAVEAGNARKYLGLGPGDPNYNRLRDFFGPKHLFSEIFV
ncbi:amidohydrolase family protein [Roseibium sp. RKSG952]|uniref:amidohydrolase family protein n=1 Tax=Roseibium sp. RKSG952 TaxID=2529384 RepID=UPI0018AD1EA8|nr:amidohydrolase family protein [Roseibium sp. RKSG952]